MLIDKGIQSESSGAISISESRENPESLEDISKIINVELDLILRVFPVLIDSKDRALKPVLKKKFGFPVDVLEESLLRKDLRAFNPYPSFWKAFRREKRR